MAHVAAMLVRFCPEYEAFECFVNMTHSYHFISFFRGDMREVSDSRFKEWFFINMII